MGRRGVIRPMTEKEIRMHHQQYQKHQKKHGEHHDDGQVGNGHHESGNHMMSKEQRMQMLHKHHMQTLWIYWMRIILGLWLAMSPLTFSYGKDVEIPAVGVMSGLA